MTVDQLLDRLKLIVRTTEIIGSDEVKVVVNGTEHDAPHVWFNLGLNGKRRLYIGDDPR